MDLRDETDLAMRDVPGTPPHWAILVIGAACLATVAIPAIGCRVLWDQSWHPRWIGSTAFENGLAILAVVAILAAAVPRLLPSAVLQIAVLLPAVHVVVIGATWPLWLAVADELNLGDLVSIADTISLPGLAVLLAGVGAVAAHVIARRRRDASGSQAFALFGLAHLLALGGWLPFVSRIACSGSANAHEDALLALEHGPQLAFCVLAPPLVAAIAYTAIAIRRPDWVRRHRQLAIRVGVVALCAAIFLRVAANPADAVVYGNFVPALLAAMLVACGGLVALVVAMMRQTRALRRRVADGALEGVVVAGDDEVIGAVEIAGWLRAPRALLRPFTLATATGNIRVPGAQLLAAMSPATTALRVGEGVAALRAGDAVIITDLRAASPGTDPFRSNALPIASSDTVVAPAPLPEQAFVGVALASWRPAVAYLVILLAVSLPAVAAALAPLTTPGR